MTFNSAHAALIALAVVAVPSAGLAQQKASVSVPAQNSTLNDAFKGFGSNTTDPMQIEADNLDVFDNDNLAIFTGNVTAKQRETVLKTAKLKVYYEPRKTEGEAGQQAGQAAAQAPAQPLGANQSIRRLEAEGKVLLTQNDQSVSGETGWFDMPTNKAQVIRNVVLVQGQGNCRNVATGSTLDIDLKTGLYTLRGGSQAGPKAGSGGRVVMVLDATDKTDKCGGGN